ncbi:hypothetical protein [Falsiruegeria litorea]|uniref:hypothetical protein n=1 Tax=Falsiruegeria litorea TaxID=1280831 RepID=UPI000A26F13E|nr:hypothetical protein [Falsiruegeria litorea]
MAISAPALVVAAESEVCGPWGQVNAPLFARYKRVFTSKYSFHFGNTVPDSARIVIKSPNQLTNVNKKARQILVKFEPSASLKTHKGMPED